LESSHTNLLQSWSYGIAKHKAENLIPYNFLVTQKGKQIALVQVLIKTFSFIGSTARINRGPLLLSNYDLSDKNQVTLRIIEKIIEECKQRKWLMLQIAPELEETNESEIALSNLGLSKLSNPEWSSGLIDLKREEDDILMSLKGKWRNCLRKGLKLGVEVRHNKNNIENIDKVIETYNSLQKDKNFIGLSGNLIRELANQEHNNWKFNIFSAFINNDQIGSLVTINHGDTSIYLIGATNSVGRRYQANYVMLWRAILSSKDNSCSWFDIGGLNKTTPKGIAHFKNGLQAKPYKLIGEWRIFFLRNLFFR